MPFDAPRLRELANQLRTRRHRRVLSYAAPERGPTWRERMDAMGGPWCVLLLVGAVVAGVAVLSLSRGPTRSFLMLVGPAMLAAAFALKKRYDTY